VDFCSSKHFFLSAGEAVYLSAPEQQVIFVPHTVSLSSFGEEMCACAILWLAGGNIAEILEMIAHIAESFDIRITFVIARSQPIVNFLFLPTIKQDYRRQVAASPKF
jgi:hypothetical protein